MVTEMGKVGTHSHKDHIKLDYGKTPQKWESTNILAMTMSLLGRLIMERNELISLLNSKCGA